MITKKWSEEDSRWLKANFGRLDPQTMSKQLRCSLEEVEKRVKQLKLVTEGAGPGRKSPASLKEAQRESSAARKEYEKAIDVFHKRQLDDAARRFEELIEKHPDEKELLDRARMYLAACRNGKRARAAAPSEPDEIYHAAVFEKNRGNVDRALELLRKAPPRRDDGRVHYLAACCHALAGDAEQALVALKKAIAADDHNRIQARLEMDLVALRGTQGFTELLAGGA